MFKIGDMAYNQNTGELGLVLKVEGYCITLLMIKNDLKFFFEKGEIVKVNSQLYENRTYKNTLRNGVVKDYLSGIDCKELLFKKFKNF